MSEYLTTEIDKNNVDIVTHDNVAAHSVVLAMQLTAWSQLEMHARTRVDHKCWRKNVKNV